MRWGLILLASSSDNAVCKPCPLMVEAPNDLAAIILLRSFLLVS